MGDVEAAPDQRAWPRTSRSDLLRLVASAPSVLTPPPRWKRSPQPVGLLFAMSDLRRLLH